MCVCGDTEGFSRANIYGFGAKQDFLTDASHSHYLAV